jgi:hypothetical protein
MRSAASDLEILRNGPFWRIFPKALAAQLSPAFCAKSISRHIACAAIDLEILRNP